MALLDLTELRSVCAHRYEHTERAMYDRVSSRFRSLERKLLSLESYQVRTALRVVDVDDS